jgi:hypothetical protein
MLLDSDSVYEASVTGSLQRVFPPDFPGLVEPFQSPTPNQLRQFLSDPAFLRTGLAVGMVDGLGERALNDKGVLVSLRASDWYRAAKQRIWSLSTKIGIFDDEALAAVPTAANAVIGDLQNLLSADPATLTADIGKQAAFAFFRAMSAFANAPGTLAISYIASAVQAYSFLETIFAGFKEEARQRLPLPSVEDRVVADRFRIQKMGTDMRSSRDWTHFFMPTYRGQPRVIEAGEYHPKDKDHRWSFLLGWGEGSDELTAGGGFGFQPGTEQILDLLEWPGRWRNSRTHEDLASWYSYRCNWVDKGCGVTVDNFRGSKDCRQCVSIDEVRSSSRGDHNTWAGLGWDMGSRAVRVGGWLENSAQACADMWGSLSWRNPAIACFNLPAIYDAWQGLYEDFFEAMPAFWERYNAHAWRAVISSFAACGLLSQEDGLIGGVGTLLDWRYPKWDRGGQTPIEQSFNLAHPPVPVLHSQLPSGDMAVRTITPTPFDWRFSVFEQAIRPALESVGRQALALYNSTGVAYLWPDQALHADANGKLRRNQFGDAYEAGLRDLLEGPARYSVDMRHVVSPEIRQLLLDKGVDQGQIGLGVAPPVLGDLLPPRYFGPPRAPVVGLDGNPFVPPDPPPPPLGGAPGQGTRPAPPRAAVRPRSSGSKTLVIGAAALGGLGLLKLLRR